MKTVALIQCRTGSSRLPGKVLLEICGKPVLAHLVERVQRATGLDEIVLATSTEKGDDAIEKLGATLGVSVFRGSEQDVLGRLSDAAKAHSADRVIQLWGDSPLIDPAVIEHVLSYCPKTFSKGGTVGASNWKTGYPAGIELHAYLIEALLESEREAKANTWRENAGLYIREKSDQFPLALVEPEEGLRHPEIRLLLDVPEDFVALKSLFEHFYPSKPTFDVFDIVEYFLARAEVS